MLRLGHIHLFLSTLLPLILLRFKIQNMTLITNNKILNYYLVDIILKTKIK